MLNPDKPKYQIRFFFDYHCGGCLWSGNESTWNDFGSGCLDSPIYDKVGNIIQPPRIEFPIATRERVIKLDELFADSLNWNNPEGPSNWKKSQWDEFFANARELYKEIADLLGQNFELHYEAEK